MNDERYIKRPGKLRKLSVSCFTTHNFNADLTISWLLASKAKYCLMSLSCRLPECTAVIVPIARQSFLITCGYLKVDHFCSLMSTDLNNVVYYLGIHVDEQSYPESHYWAKCIQLTANAVSFMIWPLVMEVWAQVTASQLFINCDDLFNVLCFSLDCGQTIFSPQPRISGAAVWSLNSLNWRLLLCSRRLAIFVRCM